MTLNLKPIYRKVPILIGITFSLTGVLFILFCRMAESVEMLLIGRILIGFEAGISTSTVIMYLIELSPVKFRGSVGTCLSLGISSGILIGQVCSLEEVLGTEKLWQYAITAHAVFKLICLFSFPWFPESPKFLYLVSGNKQKAIKCKYLIAHMTRVHFLLTHLYIIYFIPSANCLTRKRKYICNRRGNFGT